MTKVACFTTDETGRTRLAEFQRSYEIINATGGELVNQGKKEPCVWITYNAPITEIEEYPIDNDSLPKKSKSKK